MKENIFILLLLSLLSTGYTENVSDFAPIKLGNTWVYSLYVGTATSLTTRRDSGTLQLTISEIIQKGDDSLIVFNCKEVGISFYNQWYSSNGPINDTSDIDSSYLDTVIVTKDSITGFYSLYQRFYGFTRLPFWRSHAINIDSLKTGYYDNDSVYYYSADRIEPNYYIQNVGLYSFIYWRQASGSGTNRLSRLQLLSFNNKGSTLPIITKQTGYTHTGKVSNRHKKIVLNNNTPNNGTILLNGKKIFKSTHIPLQAIIHSVK